MRDQRIYWTDSQGKSISRAYTNGSGVQKIIQLDTEFPEGQCRLCVVVMVAIRTRRLSAPGHRVAFLR